MQINSDFSKKNSINYFFRIMLLVKLPSSTVRKSGFEKTKVLVGIIQFMELDLLDHLSVILVDLGLPVQMIVIPAPIASIFVSLCLSVPLTKSLNWI